MILGILTDNNPKDATHRITIQALSKSLKELGHEVVDAYALKTTPDAIFSTRHIDPTDQNIEGFLKECKDNNIPIYVFINDVYRVDNNRLQQWALISDIIFTPTKCHKIFIESICSNRVEVLPDSIDYLIDTPIIKTHKNNSKTKICWFGSPESYNKSMNIYQPLIDKLIKDNLIEYTIISNFPEVPNHIKYIPFSTETFCKNLQQFDLCVLSHSPLDYDINTIVKSPNKLTLSISLGVPCVVSRTPSYREVLEECQLEEYCFSSPLELEKIIKTLSSPEKRNEYLEKSQNKIINKFKYQNLGKIFLHEINRK